MYLPYSSAIRLQRRKGHTPFLMRLNLSLKQKAQAVICIMEAAILDGGKPNESIALAPIVREN